MKQKMKTMFFFLIAASALLVRCSPAAGSEAGSEKEAAVPSASPPMTSATHSPAAVFTATPNKRNRTATIAQATETPSYIPIRMDDAALQIPPAADSSSTIPNRAERWDLNAGDGRHYSVPAVGPDGSIWITARYGLFRYSRGNWMYHPLPEEYAGRWLSEGIAVAPDGRVWTGLTGFGPVVFDGQDWHAYPDHGLEYPQTILAMPNGEIWAAGSSAGIARWKDGQFEHFRFFEEVNGQPSAFCSAAAAPGGTLWFGSCFAAGKKLLSYDGREWTRYSVDVPVFITSLAVDRDGILWVGAKSEGTGGMGLYRWDGKNVRLFAEAEGLDDTDVRFIAVAPDNSIWLTSCGGAYRFDGTRFASFLGEASIFPIVVSPGGEVWLGGTGEVVRLYRDGGG